MWLWGLMGHLKVGRRGGTIKVVLLADLTGNLLECTEPPGRGGWEVERDSCTTPVNKELCGLSGGTTCHLWSEEISG